jgi:dienelactone hydrolase
MTQILVFHHVQGLTDGVRDFAARLAGDEHVVHVPDLYDGRLFGDIDAGIAHAQSLDRDEVGARVDAIADGLSADLVVAGFSWGAMHAQRLAQTRPGCRGALLYEAFVALGAEWSFGPWPAGVRAQVHGMDADPFFALEGDLDAARELVDVVGPEQAELFTYPGDAHLFTDSSLPQHDPAATRLVLERSRAFLARA